MSLKLKIKKEQKQAIEYLQSANSSWPSGNKVFYTNTNNQLPCFDIDRLVLCSQKQNSRCKKCADNFYNRFVILKQHYKTDGIMTIQNCEDGCIYGGSLLYLVYTTFMAELKKVSWWFLLVGKVLLLANIWAVLAYEL